MAGAKRYKAGTIFIDVTPSFDDFQNAIRRKVRNSGTQKIVEDEGRKLGEAQGKAEAEGRQKFTDKARANEVSKTKAVNKAFVSDTSRAWREAGRAAAAGEEQITKAVKKGADQRTSLRRTEAEEAQNLRKQIDYAHGEAIKEQKARDKAASRERKDEAIADRKVKESQLKLFGQLFRSELAKQQDAEKATAKEREGYLKDFGIALGKALKSEGYLRDRMREEQLRDDEELANLMALGRERAVRAREEADEAESQRHRLELEEREKAEADHWKTVARQAEDAAKEEQKARDRRSREGAERDKRAIREREARLESSGGRIGRLIRKSVGAALDDLPDVEVDADSTKVDRSIAEIRGKLLKLRDTKIGVDISTGQARTALRTIKADLETLSRTHDGSLDINVMAALASLQAVDEKIDKVQRNASRPIWMRIMTTGSRIDQKTSRGGAARGLLGIRGSGEDGANAFRIFNAMVLAVVASISLLGPLLAVAAAGLVTIAGTAIAAGGALGVLALGFQGVFQAIQDQIKAEDDLGKRAAQTARTRAQGDRQVRDAKERLADAERDAAWASEDASRRVEDAEERLRDAQEASAKAQRDLNEARQEAKRDIQDLAFAYDQAKLDEKEAALGITQAQERLNEMRRRRAMGDASASDVRDAELGVQQARLRARRATVDRRRAGEDSSRASRRGVEGSDQVVAAKDRIEAAQKAEVEAAEGVTDALREQGRVAQRNARSIRDATQAIADAQQAAADSQAAMSSAAYDAQQSMSDLSSEGQRFARFILSLRGGYKELRNLAQAGMLPGLEEGMRELAVYESGFKKFVGDMSKMWGDSFRSMGKQLTGPTWRSFFDTMGKDGPKQAKLLNQALFNVMTTVAALVDAFSPLTTDMLTWLEKATAGWAAWAAGLKGSPGFERFLSFVEKVAPVVRDLFVSLGAALINIGVALAPFAEGFAKVLTSIFNWIAGMDPKVLGQIVVAVIALVFGIQMMAGAMSLAAGAVIALTNPVALLILGITALSVWMIHLYQTNETARGYIDKFLGVLKSMATWIWENRKGVGIFVGVLAGLFVIGKIALAIAGFVMTATKMAKVIRLVGLAVRFVALLFNPWVLVIAVIAAGLIYLWKTNDTFRENVIKAWEWIKRAMSAVADWWTTTASPAIAKAFDWISKNAVPVFIAALQWLKKAAIWVLDFLTTYWTIAFNAISKVVKWLWSNILKPAFTELMAWINEIIAPALKWLWSNVFKPAFTAIGNAAKALWNDFLKPAFDFIVHFVKTILAPTLKWLWNNVVKPVFTFIGKKVASIFQGTVLPIFRQLRHVLKNVIGPVFSWLWKNAVQPAMRGISAAVKWVWDKVSPNFDRLKKGLDNVRKAFVSARDGIARIWKKVADKIRDPLKDAMAWIDEHFLSKVRAVLRAIGAEALADAIPDLSGGSKSNGKRTTAERMRVGSRTSGDAAYAAGGRVGGPFRSKTMDNVLGIDYSGTPVAWVNPKEYILPVDATERLARTVGVGGLEMLRRGEIPMPRLARGGFTYPAMVEWLQRSVPGAVVTSTKRNRGTGSYHDSGKAIDIGGPADIMRMAAQAIMRSFGSSITELIHNPGFSVKDGKRVGSGFWGSSTWNAHRDHVHWAMASMAGGKGFGDKILDGIFGPAQMATGIAADVASKGASALTSVLDKMPGADTFAGKMAIAPMKLLSEEVASMVQQFNESAFGPTTGDDAAPGGGVERWRGTVLKALGIAGLSERYANVTLRQMMTESSGNPRAINNWDSNAAKGTPSKGLMQVIDPTFRAYAHPKYNRDIYDPLSNILASIRYAVSRYGDLFKAYRGVGYASGTDSAAAGWALVGEEGPELMRFRGGEQVYNRQQTMRLAELSAQRGGATHITAYVQNPFTGEYLLSQVDERIDDNESFKASVGRMH